MRDLASRLSAQMVVKGLMWPVVRCRLKFYKAKRARERSAGKARRRGGTFKFCYDVGTVAQGLVLAIPKVNLNTKLWDIMTRWDLRWMYDRVAPRTGSLKVYLRTSSSMGSGSLRVAMARFLEPKGAPGRLAHRNDRRRMLGVRSDRRERAPRDRVRPQWRPIVGKNTLIESGEVVYFVASCLRLDWIGLREERTDGRDQELLAWARTKK